MAWKRFWKRHEPPSVREPEAAETTAVIPGIVGKRPPPGHLSRQGDGAPRRTGTESTAEGLVKRRLAAMERQRLAVLYDIEQGELASADDNPWQHRIELLTQAMATVAEDLETLRSIPPGPYAAVPATQIAIDLVNTEPVASVRFHVGSETFDYAEDPDWAERGHQMIRTELVRRQGDPAALVPDTVPPDLREPLRDHLGESLFVFASDLRDRALDSEALPDSATLADLARPCPRCGGWTDWRGTCQACAARAADEGALKREESRLLDERAREAEERHRLVEGLPLARRRLRDLEVQIASLAPE